MAICLDSLEHLVTFSSYGSHRRICGIVIQLLHIDQELDKKALSLLIAIANNYLPLCVKKTQLCNTSLKHDLTLLYVPGHEAIRNAKGSECSAMQAMKSKCGL